MTAFGIVEPGVYRSNAPSPANFSFLRTLQLKTVVYLSPELLVRPVVNLFEEKKVKFVLILSNNY